MVQGPRRLLITGSSGSGKTRLAATLSARIRVPHIELDGLYHGPNWTHPDPEAFRHTVSEAVGGSAWVVDGNYRTVSDIVRARADLIIALDLPRPVVLVQLLRRTATRILTRAELWNGNREDWRNLLKPDPQLNVLLWSHQNFSRIRKQARDDERSRRSGGPAVVRLTSRAQIARFTEYLAASDR